MWPFGYGEHYCLGANLARMELQEIFREIVTRLTTTSAHAKPRRLARTSSTREGDAGSVHAGPVLTASRPLPSRAAASASFAQRAEGDEDDQEGERSRSGGARRRPCRESAVAMRVLRGTAGDSLGVEELGRFDDLGRDRSVAAFAMRAA